MRLSTKERRRTEKDGQDGCELRYEMKNPQLSSKVSTKFDEYCCSPRPMTLAIITLSEGVTHYQPALNNPALFYM